MISRNLFGVFFLKLKTKERQTKTDDFLKILTTSKRTPIKMESDLGMEFYKSIFQNFLKVNNINLY